MTSATRLAPLTDNAEVIAALSDILVEVVANGGSVSFMHPLAHDFAADFWKDSFARASRGGRVVLGAWEGDDLIGTVTLDLATPPNQPHRAEVAQLMTRIGHRGRGVARSLMLEADASPSNAAARSWFSTPPPKAARRVSLKASAINASASSLAMR